MKPCAALLFAAALLLSGCASINTYVVLLPQEDGTPAAIMVGAGNQLTLLDKPYSVAMIDDKSRIETKTVSPEDANRIFVDALAAQPPPAISFILYFETNSIEVTAASRPTLDELFAAVAKRQAVEVQVTGHTDRVGSVADNDRLSLQRAEAMRAMLIKRGINSNFLRAVGRGEREPLVQTSDEQPEPRNRRVEVIVR